MADLGCEKWDTSFNGAGDTWTPPWISLFVSCSFEVPLAWILCDTSLEFRGVFVAITAAYCGLALVSATIFRRGTWKTKVV